MKNLIVLLFLFSVPFSGFTQDFSIPERTSTQKHNRLFYLMSGNIAVGIAGAKEAGMSPREYASFCGNQFKHSWNKEAGFKGFAQGTLANYESGRRENDPAIEILEQSSDKLVFSYYNNFKTLYNNGPMFGTTYEEFLIWVDLVYRQIGEHLGATYQQEEMEDDRLKISITKK